MTIQNLILDSSNFDGKWQNLLEHTRLNQYTRLKVFAVDFVACLPHGGYDKSGYPEILILKFMHKIIFHEFLEVELIILKLNFIINYSVKSN